jgi:hypothetical protein
MKTRSPVTHTHHEERPEIDFERIELVASSARLFKAACKAPAGSATLTILTTCLQTKMRFKG